MAMAPDPSKHDMGGPIDDDVLGDGGFSGSAGHRPLTEEGSISCSAVSVGKMASSSASLVYRGKGKPSIRDWGYPGYLSEEECRVYEQFCGEISRRDEAFRSAVFTFERANEDRCYAICRWLRARKFVLSDAITMIEEGVVRRADAAASDFFPDPHHALGVEACIYHSQYPQFYCGYAKGGYPLFVSKAGMLDTDGLECVTTTESILNFHWYDMMHDYVQQLRQQAKLNPAFKRYETVVIMDLNGLTSSQLTKRSLNIVKVQSELDSLCFPETLHQLVIINAPSFFAMTWKIMKGWVDERTANKVTIVGTNRAKWTKKLRELVDEENLPEDYGGTAASTESFTDQKTVSQYEQIEAAERRGSCANGARTFTPAHLEGETVTGHNVHLFAVRSNASHSVGLTAGESMRISVFTRSLAGGTLNVSGPGRKKFLPKGVLIKHLGKDIDEENPTRVNLDLVLRGPGRFKIKLESQSGPFSVDDFLFVGKLFVSGGKPPSRIAGEGDRDVVEAAHTRDLLAHVCAPKSSDDDSSEDIMLCDASSLGDQLCFNGGLTKDSIVPASSFLNGSGVVVVPEESKPATSPLKEESTELVPPATARANSFRSSVQPHDEVGLEQGGKTTETATTTASAPPATVAVEPEQVPNTFVCGAFAGPSLREIFSKLLCTTPATKR